MSNVLSEEKKQQVLAPGRLGWTLRRIEQASGVRRETAGAYLKVARIGVRPPQRYRGQVFILAVRRHVQDIRNRAWIGAALRMGRNLSSKPLDQCGRAQKCMH